MDSTKGWRGYFCPNLDLTSAGELLEVIRGLLYSARNESETGEDFHIK